MTKWEDVILIWSGLGPQDDTTVPGHCVSFRKDASNLSLDLIWGEILWLTCCNVIYCGVLVSGEDPGEMEERVLEDNLGYFSALYFGLAPFFSVGATDVRSIFGSNCLRPNINVSCRLISDVLSVFTLVWSVSISLWIWVLDPCNCICLHWCVLPGVLHIIYIATSGCWGEWVWFSLFCLHGFLGTPAEEKQFFRNSCR